MEIQQVHIQLPHAESASIELIALKDGQVIGQLRLDSLLEPGLWVTLLFVSEKFRGQGVGKALLFQAVSIAHQRNKTSLTLTICQQRASTTNSASFPTGKRTKATKAGSCRCCLLIKHRRTNPNRKTYQPPT